MPKIRKLFLLLSLAICLLANNANAQFAYESEVGHECGVDDGYIIYELNGNSDDYTYYWAHGPQTLAIYNLSPGTYTLFVTNNLGCIEEYETTILQVGECSIDASVHFQLDGFPEVNECERYIVITVTMDGQILSESALNIVWDDANPAGLVRRVNGKVDGEYCVEVSLNGIGGCCKFEECIPIYVEQDCDVISSEEDTKKCKLIVNEFNRAKNGDKQYVELLVKCKGDCEERIDLRGFSLDDNNGLLINPNEFVTESNYELFGINEGFLSFRHIDEWSAVPNGSLIVIYSDIGEKESSIPEDDFADSNGDRVYVLSADESFYFSAKTGNWNNDLQELEYGGSLMNPSWATVDISDKADGLQVRTKEGEYEHGVSLGTSSMALDYTFPLWITANTSETSNCRLLNGDFDLKASYNCDASVLVSQSPGLGNSIANEEMINALKECTGSRGDDKSILNLSYDQPKDINVFPNPFSRNLTINFKVEKEGISKLKILSVTGQLLFEDQIKSTQGNNRYEFSIQDNYPDGMLMIRLEFPDGSVRSARVIRMK